MFDQQLEWEFDGDSALLGVCFSLNESGGCYAKTNEMYETGLSTYQRHVHKFMKKYFF
jgi:hypothetical protein